MYKDELKGISFAPNSTFHHYVEMGKDTYKAGSYIAHIKVNSPYGNWQWNELFEIKTDVAKKLNEESVSIERMSQMMKIMILVVILLVVLLLIILYVMRRKLKAAKNNKT